MQVLNLLGGLPLSRALTLIKAISKKKKKVIEAERPAFIEGAAKNGIGPEEAERLFALIEKFAGYGFNKAHSTGYAIIAYQTAWFKRHHPPEFWAATLTYESDSIEKLGKYISTAKRSGMRVLPPDINISETQFSVDGELVRFGLSAVKGVGAAAVEAILAARTAEGPFASLHDLCRRVDRKALNRAAIEALIRCGALDRCGGGHRAQRLAGLDDAMASAASEARDRAAGQLSLFGGAAEVAAPESKLPDVPAWSVETLLTAERETLGFCLTGHPVDDFAVEARSLRLPRALSLESLDTMADRAQVQICGAIAQMNERIVKRGRTAGRKMCVVALEDGDTGKAEAVFYPETFERAAGVLKDGKVLVLRGSVQTGRGQGASIAVNEAYEVDAILPTAVSRLLISVRQEDMSRPGFEDSLLRVFEAHRGRCPVSLRIDATAWDLAHFTIEVGPDYAVTPSHALVCALRELIPPQAIAFEPKPLDPPRPRFASSTGAYARREA